MQVTSTSGINIINGDIFDQKKGLIVIPRSTTGSMSEPFISGLEKLSVYLKPNEHTELGTVQIVRAPSKNYPELSIALATCVVNNRSDYEALYIIGHAIRNTISELGVTEIYCPLLGSGAGNLDPFLAYVYLSSAFRNAALSESPVRANFHVVIYKKEGEFLMISEANKLPFHELMRRVIEKIYHIKATDESVQNVLNSKDFYFSIAQKRLKDFENFKISDEQKQQLSQEYEVFDGSFRAFIESRKNETETEYLSLLGEVITYLDTNAYNKEVWNQYSDKRAIARAGIRQNFWVKYLLRYGISPRTDILSPGIRNAISYVLEPESRLPILSSTDRKNIYKTFIGPESSYNETSFDAEVLRYFSNIEGLKPVVPINFNVMIMQVLYSPMAKMLWDTEAAGTRETGSVVASSPEPVKSSSASTSSASTSPTSAQSNNETSPQSSNNTSARLQEPKKAGQETNARKPSSTLYNDSSASNDLLNHKLYSEAIVKYITDPQTVAPLTIGILAPWGMGKTSMMKFIQRDLEEKFPNRELAEEQQASRGIFERAMNFYTKQTRLIKRRFDIKTLSKELDKDDEATEKHRFKYPTIWFNAWKYENSEQVLSGLAHEIIRQLAANLPDDFERERFYFRLHRKRINIEKLKSDIRMKAYGAFFNGISLILYGVMAITALMAALIERNIAPMLIGGTSGVVAVVNSIISFAKTRQEEVSKSYNDYVKQPEYEDKLGYFHDVEADLKEVFKLLVDKNDRCVIFIDDLDRCSPSKVVEVIEAINLFTNGEFPHCYFVVGMDAQMVATSIESAYSDLDTRLTQLQRSHGSLGWYYLEKFIQLQFIIPNMKGVVSKSFLKHLLQNENGFQAAQAENLEMLNQKVLNLDFKNSTDLKKIIEEIAALEQVNQKAAYDLQIVIIQKAFREFSFVTDDIESIVENYYEYLMSSPRVIKRFVNLFRFYRNFLVPLKAFENERIAQMVILSLRWPQLPRLIQWNVDMDLINAHGSLYRADFIDQKIQNTTTWEEMKNSVKDRVDYKWMFEDGLHSYITKHHIQLRSFVEAGIW